MTFYKVKILARVETDNKKEMQADIAVALTDLGIKFFAMTAEEEKK